MPYAKRHRHGKWIVVNSDTGEVKGTHETEAKADAQMRLLYGIMRGWRPTGKK